MNKVKRVIHGFIKYKYLLVQLVKKGVILRYRRSYLGLIWTLLEPFLNMLVLTFVFGTLFGTSDKTYPVYILSGRLLYSCFSQSTKAALRSIRANRGMINKVYVPKYLYPLSSVLYSYVIFLFSLIVLVLVAAFLKIWPTPYLFLAVIPMTLLLLLSIGVGMILSTLGVFFRDMEYIWDVLLMLLMYLCAIFYYPDRFVSVGRGWVLDYNPLYCIITQFRNCIYGLPLEPFYVLYSGLWCLITLIIGFGVFYKRQDKFILYI